MAFGGSILWFFYPDGKIPYEDWLSLEMNAERIMLRQAVNVALGTLVATGKGGIDRAYYDALCADEEEVDETAARTNALRDLAAMRAER